MSNVHYFQDPRPRVAVIEEDSSVASAETDIALLRKEVSTLSAALKSSRARDAEAIEAMRETLDKYLPWIEQQQAREAWWAKLRQDTTSKIMTGSAWGTFLALCYFIGTGAAHWLKEWMK